MYENPLRGKGPATGLVSVVDKDLSLQHKWYGITGYACTQFQGRTTYLHRLIMARVMGRDLLRREEVDHINGEGLDNRRENLRLATHAQNLKNLKVPKNSTTGFKGVSFRKDKRKYEAYIKYDNNPRKRLGYFKTAKEAAEAYNDAAAEFHGEYARLNVVEASA